MRVTWTVKLISFAVVFVLASSCRTRFESKPMIAGGGQGKHSQILGRSAALILIEDDAKNPAAKRFCSAVAVSPIHVLTAAHCLLKNEQAKNFFFPGYRHRATSKPLDTAQISVFFTEKLSYIFKDSRNSNRAARRDVERVWINEDYRRWQRPLDTGFGLEWGNWVLFPEMNDIALLTLTRRIPNPLVPADVPDQGTTIDIAESRFVMTGYGAQGVLPAFAPIGDLQFFSFQSLSDPRVGFNIVYKPQKNLFAFDSYQSAIPCDGDSGGPLFRSDSETGYLDLVAVFSASLSGGGLCLSKALTYTTVSSFTDVLRCHSGSSLTSSTNWILTDKQRERCRALEIKPPVIADSRFTETAETIDVPTAQTMDAQRLVYFTPELIQECNAEKIKKAYHQLSLKYHPDLAQGAEKKRQAEEIQKDVNLEHELIKKVCGL
jgi:hypothetical protein